jgi:hypothetical protein
MEEPYGDTMDEGGEAEDDVSTDYGSLQLGNENFEDFEELDQASYDEYRWEQLFNAHGVEHYVVKQLAWLRRLPVNEAMWNEIRDLMSLQKSIQLGGPEVRTFEHELSPTCWGDDATFSGAAWGVWTLMKSRRRAYSLTSWPR